MTAPRNRLLLGLVVFLLATNVVLLIMFFTKKPQEPRKHAGFTERLKSEVRFTDEQMAVLEPRKKVFREEIKRRFELIKRTKEGFYYTMYNPSVPDSAIAAKAALIGRQQQELDLFVFRHFRDVRAMCTPEQLPRYDSLFPYIVDRMTARPSRK